MSGASERLGFSKRIYDPLVCTWHLGSSLDLNGVSGVDNSCNQRGEMHLKEACLLL